MLSTENHRYCWCVALAANLLVLLMQCRMHPACLYFLETFKMAGFQISYLSLTPLLLAPFTEKWGEEINTFRVQVNHLFWIPHSGIL